MTRAAKLSQRCALAAMHIDFFVESSVSLDVRAPTEQEAPSSAVVKGLLCPRHTLYF